ncbi:MAG: Photosynthesis system assembly factor [Pseudonocardiales bacterium]|jgi:photosystem II stability/assembly factor-like uncharacterized protein|nr:Photosynthesis system assembly factor [Pseudonocardiales bacterium]
MTDPNLETRLRETLRAQARRAPQPEDTVREVLLTVAAHRPHRLSRWHTWTVPLVAAGAVAAVAAALVGIQHVRTAANRVGPAGPPPSVSVSIPSGPAQSPSTSAASVVAPAPGVTSGAPSPVSVGLRHFSVTDLSFVGSDGWAWGSADCTSGAGQGGHCAAMVRTTDGGATWHSVPGPPANVALLSCDDPCVRSIRFASPSVGYAFGPSALFMTTDSGRTWQRQKGGADALESLDGNVIRISSACLPGCPPLVQTSSIGSATWAARALPPGAPGFGVSLVRTGSAAYLLAMGHTSGGAQNATSVLFSSADDGGHWSARGEPCPQGPAGGTANGEQDSVAVAAAVDGSVAVLCTPRGAAQNSFVAVSTDQGATFHRAGGGIGTGPDATLFAAATSRTLLVMGDVLYRSGDGGASWTRVQHNGVGPLTASWIGFESPTEGRVIEAGTTIWTTHDAGVTWTAVALP